MEQILNIRFTRRVRRVLKIVYRMATFWRKRRPYSNDYAYQAQHMLHVPDQGIILDIASGHNPFPRATILSDRFLEITAHRKEEIILDHRPFVILDMHHLPFKSKTIDYIYCSHVIEHADNPEQVCAELMRVGKSGYIEAPTFMKDALFGWAAETRHKWYVVQFENGLVFFEYDKHRWQGVKSPYWRRAVLSSYYHPLQDLFYPNQYLFNSILEWKDRFDVTVFRLNRTERKQRHQDPPSH
jgi:SAM-dependent methyltransferase